MDLFRRLCIYLTVSDLYSLRQKHVFLHVCAATANLLSQTNDRYYLAVLYSHATADILPIRHDQSIPDGDLSLNWRYGIFVNSCKRVQ